jgi:hypothetical protein
MSDRKSFWRRLPGVLGWLLLLLAVTAVVWRIFIYPWAYSWGATEEEQTMPLPGDEFGTASAPQHTWGLTIRAPAMRCGNGWSRSARTGEDSTAHS